MSKADEPAFPTAGIQNNEESLPVGGLTKREYFAAMAMHGIIQNPGSGSVSISGIARDALRQADALLAELEKEPTK